MDGLSSMLRYLLMFCGGLATALVALVIYGNVLDTRADEEIYLNKTEERIMASEQVELAGKMSRLARVIIVLAIITGVSLLATASVWVYIGLNRT